MPELRGLILNCCDQMRMGMAKRIHRYAAGEIEIAVAVGGDQPWAFPALERNIDPGKDRQHMGIEMRRDVLAHGDLVDDEGSDSIGSAWALIARLPALETKRAARIGGTWWLFYWRAACCQSTPEPMRR